ncbi:ribosome biogenesis GTPase Der, partial [Escherichia coli]|nr:ribosome biogenesis GTPase Der [Escherichia coli]
QIAAAHGRGVTALLERALSPFFDDLLTSESEEGEIEDLTGFEDEEPLVEDYTEEDAEAEFKRLQEQPIKLAIIGRPNVGKSTLT